MTVASISAGLACVVVAAVWAWRPPLGPAGRRPEAPPVVHPAPRISADPLDGETVPPGLTDRRPIAVIIDNHPEARPQWGVGAASRVYEAITEGGITRYLAVYGRGDASRVGPVRSVRTQFLDYAAEVGAGVAHVGGNEDALDIMPRLRIPNLDEFRFAEAYHRIFHPGIAYEHTMFTSTTRLRALRAAMADGGSLASDPQLWKEDRPVEQRPRGSTVTIDFSLPAYRVSWVYRPATNEYARVIAGRPDIDAGTGSQLTAKVVAIAGVPRMHARTHIGEDTWIFADLGSGPAWVVEDGAMVPGTWRKASAADRLRFLDAAGHEIAFDRGTEWIEIIPPEVTPLFAFE
jgi:Protein of unknown function (DUF3048) N-terminal domain/Protein of unknown function (DUF3048) C-terminal domain